MSGIWKLRRRKSVCYKVAWWNNCKESPFCNERLRCLRRQGCCCCCWCGGYTVQQDVYLHICRPLTDSWTVSPRTNLDATVCKDLFFSPQLNTGQQGTRKLPRGEFVHVIFVHGTRKLTQDWFPVNRTSVAYAVCTFCRFLGGWVMQAPFSPLIPSKLWEQF